MEPYATPPPAVTQLAPAPPGVLPRRGQTWLMLGVAVGIILIILFTGHQPTPTPTRPPTATRSTADANPEQLRNYQQRLAADAASRTRSAAGSDGTVADPRADLRLASVDAGAIVSGNSSGMVRAQKPEDALAADRAKREYESLFASNVVTSQNPALMSAAAKSTTTAATRPASALDNLTAQLLRPAISAATTAASNTTAAPITSLPAAPAVTAPAAPMVTARPVQEPSPADGPTHRVLEGTLIDAVLTNRLDGSSAGPVNCLVSSPVYADDGRTVLIPAGARILGTTKAVQAFGETKLAVAFDRLLMPNGRTYSLDHFVGLDAVGDAGVRDQVNNHYAATFGASAAVGLISGFAQFLTGTGLGTPASGTVIVTGTVGTGAAQATSQTMSHFLNRLPTITIREGHRIKVYLTNDVQLPAYQAARAARQPGLRVARQEQP